MIAKEGMKFMAEDSGLRAKNEYLTNKCVASILNTKKCQHNSAG